MTPSVLINHPLLSVVDRTGLLVRSELHLALRSIGIVCSNAELDDLLAFADADGSMAIDLDEWLMLIGLLVQPPYDETELVTSFEVCRVVNADESPMSTSIPSFYFPVIHKVKSRRMSFNPCSKKCSPRRSIRPK